MKNYSDNRDKATNDVTELPTVLELLGDLNEKKILDIGCGLGIHAHEFIKRGAHVTGFDASEKMIELTKERCGDKGKFYVADYEDTDLDENSFDIITASLSLNYSSKLDKVFLKIYSWLKPNGIFTFSIPHPNWLYFRVKDMDYSYPHEIQIFIKSYNVDLSNYYRPLGDYIDLININDFKLLNLVETTIPKSLKGYPEEKYRLPCIIVFKLQKI